MGLGFLFSKMVISVKGLPHRVLVRIKDNGGVRGGVGREYFGYYNAQVKVVVEC